MRRIWRRGSWVLLLLSVTLLGTGCFLPLGWGATEGDTEESTGTITVHLGGIGASTLVPDFGAIVDSYRVTATRSGYADLVVSNAASPISLPALALGTWTVTVEAIDTDNGDAVVGMSEPKSVAVDSGDVTSVTITVGPTTAGSGDLDLMVTWPSSESLTVGAFTLTPDGGSDVSGSVTQSTITDGVHLSTSGATISAGSYTLLLQLQRSGADVATVIEAVRIYDNVTTTATIDLAAGEIGDSPLSPTDFSVTEESGAVVLNWTDASNTELSYVVERSENGGSSYVELDGSLAAGSTTYTDATRVVGTTYTYRVSAVNDFGSSPSSTTLTVLGNEELTIDLDVSEPTAPVLSFSGDAAELDRALGETLSVTVSGGSFSSVVWYLNGSMTYPDGVTDLDIDSADDSVSIDSAQLTQTGTYTVSALLTDTNGQTFSASFSFELVASYEELLITVVLDEPAAPTIEFDFGVSDGQELDRALGETMSVTATGGSFSSVVWYLNGSTTYPDGNTAIDGDTDDAVVTIDSSLFDQLGSYTVTALVTESGNSYSGSFSFNLIASYEDLSIDVTIDEPADESVEISGLDTPVSLGDSRAATASSGYTGGYTWHLNGDTAYPDTSSFSVTTTTTTGDTFTIDTSKLDAGTHTVTVVVENSSGQMYSTQTTLNVEN